VKKPWKFEKLKNSSKKKLISVPVIERYGTEMKKEVFANYAENCSKLKILKFLTLKMPEFVTCKFVKRLKTNRIWREKKKKIWKIRISEKLKRLKW